MTLFLAVAALIFLILACFLILGYYAGRRAVYAELTRRSHWDCCRKAQAHLREPHRG